jgi:hypothetical protein
MYYRIPSNFCPSNLTYQKTSYTTPPPHPTLPYPTPISPTPRGRKTIKLVKSGTHPVTKPSKSEPMVRNPAGEVSDSDCDDSDTYTPPKQPKKKSTSTVPTRRKKKKPSRRQNTKARTYRTLHPLTSPSRQAPCCVVVAWWILCGFDGRRTCDICKVEKHSTFRPVISDWIGKQRVLSDSMRVMSCNSCYCRFTPPFPSTT